ncbi:MAG: efflux RND transporter periplasmic adaptor subunit [Candidatus Obscuribacterales bacterium]
MPKELGEREVYLSPEARKLAKVEVTRVTRAPVSAEIRLIAEVDYDETRVAHITAWVPGRIEKLYVDYTGRSVEVGEPMLDLYSPELISAQEELISALKTRDKLKAGVSEVISGAITTTVNSAREKLRLWGLTTDQIDEIEKSGVPSDFLTIHSPIGGIVVEKMAFEGMYVDEGTRLYTVADLSVVWIHLEAYESDLAWLRVGQRVTFTVGALPGQKFMGIITFIDPIIDPKTRTVEVRVETPNRDLLLKPGMFANASIKALLVGAGQIKKLTGYACSPGGNSQRPLAIPASAPLITGRRAVVYVADPEREGVYEGREITLGPRFGDYYVVCDGLQEGEWVVTNGNFKIDSEIQIRAKPSMMNPEGGQQPPSSGGGAGHGSK